MSNNTTTGSSRALSAEECYNACIDGGGDESTCSGECYDEDAALEPVETDMPLTDTTPLDSDDDSGSELVETDMHLSDSSLLDAGDDSSLETVETDMPLADMTFSDSSDGPPEDDDMGEEDGVEDTMTSTDLATLDGPACSHTGESCLDDTLCCEGLACCAGIPIPTGEAICYSICPISDRAIKENFSQVDPRDVLERLDALQISTWNYIDDSLKTRHIGPMAQDFSNLFEVGEDPRYIAPVDADGVAFAALQALYNQLQTLQAENRGLLRRIEQLESAEDEIGEACFALE
jgi:hypothetical protein